MAFAHSNNITVNHSTFIDNSVITNITTTSVKTMNGDGLQMILQCSSPDASFNSQARYPPPRCDKNTRLALLEHIFRWMDTGEEDILFLDGPAGAGKSAVAQTVAAMCAERRILAGSYFFFRASPSRNTIAPLIPTIAYEITSTMVRERKRVEMAVKGDPSILNRTPEEQVRRLILEPFRQSLFWRRFWVGRKRRFFIIDGLDECEGDDDQRRVVKLLGQLVDKKHAIVRCLLASRPEPQILSVVSSLPANISVARVTLNKSSWSAEEDIRTYLRSHFDDISKRLPSCVPRPWPSKEILDRLVEKAGGIFIYAATVVKYIDDEDALPMMQLEHVLGLSPGTAPFAELDMLYKQILLACPPQHRATLLHIFGLILLGNTAFIRAYEYSFIEALLDLSPGGVGVVLRRMHAILTITPSGSSSSITFAHASFGEFIFNEERSGQFFIDREREHRFLFTRCIDCMSYHGHRDPISAPMDSKVMIYAWNSWTHHSKHAGDSYFTDLVTKLHHCDKTLWIKGLPESQYRSCTNGLDAGITLLECCNTERSDSSPSPDLQVLIEELVRKLFESIFVDPLVHPKFLGVFEDPGPDFFSRVDDYVVVLAPDAGPPILLYLAYEGHIHSLGRWGASLALKTLGEPQRRWDFYDHEAVARRCIGCMHEVEKSATVGFSYATKYWAKHVSVSNNTNNTLLRMLWETGLEDRSPDQRITLTDVDLVISWLKGSPVVQPQKRELLSLWGGYHQRLASNPGLGLCLVRGERRIEGNQPKGALKENIYSRFYDFWD